METIAGCGGGGQHEGASHGRVAARWRPRVGPVSSVGWTRSHPVLARLPSPLDCGARADDGKPSLWRRERASLALVVLVLASLVACSTRDPGEGGGAGPAIAAAEDPPPGGVLWIPDPRGAAEEVPRSPLPEELLVRWMEAPYWDDGLAEVATYDASRTIYGEERPHVVTLITVKEDLDARTLVKSDRPNEVEVIPVLKLHWTASVDAGAYPYHYALSLFVDRAQPWVLRKLAGATFEWCGVTTRHLWRRGDVVFGEARSYFDGEGDMRVEADFARALSEEQLLLAARTLDLGAEVDLPLRVLPTQLDNRARPQPLIEGRLRSLPIEVVTDAAGRQHRVRPLRFEVNGQEGRDAASIRVDVALTHPHDVIRFASPRVGTLLLRSSERRAYWER